MNINYSDELIRLLEDIENKIKYLENSPNLAFELIEYDTINSFHNYNLCFQKFRNTFNHNSASQLLLFLKVVNTHVDLSKRYEKLFRDQLNELLKIIDFEHDCVRNLSPVIFCEDNNSDILEVYKRSCKNKTDEGGKPLYDIVLDKDYHSEEIGGKEEPVNFFRFRSDNLNNYHCDSLFSLYKSLLYMFDLVCAVCTYPSELLSDIVLDKEELLSSLEKELRQYAKEVGSNVERDLRKIAQNLKSSRNSSLTPDVWGRVMEEEDKLFDMAISDSWGENADRRLEHISATKEQLRDNYSLLHKIKCTCLDEELFDIRHSVETHNLLLSLNADNLELFYELVLRRNIIQREMFPEKLRAKYEEWVNSHEEKLPDDGVELSDDLSMPEILATEQAIIYWKRLQQKGFVDDHYMLLESTTRQQAAYIAELFAEKLGIRTKWKTFEDFWNINNLAQEKNQRTELGKLPSRSSEIDEIFRD